MSTHNPCFFLAKQKKIMYTPVNHSFTMVGFKGVKIILACFSDVYEKLCFCACVPNEHSVQPEHPWSLVSGFPVYQVCLTLSIKTKWLLVKLFLRTTEKRAL